MKSISKLCSQTSVAAQLLIGYLLYSRENCYIIQHWGIHPGVATSNHRARYKVAHDAGPLMLSPGPGTEERSLSITHSEQQLTKCPYLPTASVSSRLVPTAWKPVWRSLEKTVKRLNIPLTTLESLEGQEGK